MCVMCETAWYFQYVFYFTILIFHDHCKLSQMRTWSYLLAFCAYFESSMRPNLINKKTITTVDLSADEAELKAEWVVISLIKQQTNLKPTEPKKQIKTLKKWEQVHSGFIDSNTYTAVLCLCLHTALPLGLSQIGLTGIRRDPCIFHSHPLFSYVRKIHCSHLSF